MRELNVINPRRNLLPQNHVLPGRLIIALPWLVFHGPNPKTHIPRNQGSPFGDPLSSPPTRPVREINSDLRRTTETVLPHSPPLTGMIPVTRDNVDKTKNPKVLSPLVPLTEEVGGGGGGGGGGGKRSRPQIGTNSFRWGEARPFQGHLDKSISPTYRDSAENFSRYIDCLRRRSSITSALPVGVTQQQQSSRPSKRCSEAPTLAGHRGSDGLYVARILQPPISCSETRRLIPSHHRLEEVEPIPRSSFIQNGNSLLHNSSTSTPRMDNEDRLEGRIPSYLGARQHPKILPVCSSRNSFSIPGPPV